MQSTDESLLPLVRVNNNGTSNGSHGRKLQKKRSSSFNKKLKGSKKATGMTSSKKSSSTQNTTSSTKSSWDILKIIFLFVFISCSIYLIRMGYIVQQHAFSNGDESSSSTKSSFFGAIQNTQLVQKLQKWSTTLFHAAGGGTASYRHVRHQIGDLSDYICLGWRQTMNCTPNGIPEPSNFRNCSAMITNGVSGYCEVKNNRTGEIKQVLQMHCNSLRPGVKFNCDMFKPLLAYNVLSTSYVHDENFSYETCQKEFQQENNLGYNTPAPIGEDGVRNQSVGQLDLSFERGIAYVIYEKLLPGAYASIRNLRSKGCTLPIEIWYIASETQTKHPLLQVLTSEYGAYLREIKDKRATHFYTKLYAIFYSAFDNILLLDADNFAVRDPTYLFETKEFLQKGALFWPDFWRPGNTIFNIHEKSFVWEVFGLIPVDTFEQESGQILINRRQHLKALNTLMFYGFKEPRIPEEMRLVWGDKDLFRFAWMKTDSSFYMIERPPGSAGMKHSEHKLFCGTTMVQHDPEGKIIFLHRNTEKISSKNLRRIWTHIQQFKRNGQFHQYIVRGANGGKVFPQFKRCFGKDVHYEKLFTLKPMSAFPFAEIEESLLKYIQETENIIQKGRKITKQ
jgi:alpha 1,2-mannosyltransferase